MQASRFVCPDTAEQARYLWLLARLETIGAFATSARQARIADHDSYIKLG